MSTKYIIIALFLFQFLSGNIFADYYDEPQVIIEDSTLNYEGILSIEGFKKIKNEIRKTKQKVKWLYINSAGGEIDISMDIALWVFNNSINVKVYNVCLSSCANYIFPAGKNKVIEKNAIVAWHGSAIQDSLSNPPLDQIENILAPIEDPKEKEQERNKIIKSHENYIAKMKQKQETFFKTIGVDQSITVIGQSKKYNVKKFWSISVKDMAKFGITNVTAPDNYKETVVSKSGQIAFINPIVAKVGGLQSQGAEAEAVVGYCEASVTPDLEFSGFPEG